MKTIQKDLWSGKLDPSPYRKSELSNKVFCTFSSKKERICKWIQISNSLGEETALVNVSISKGGLKRQRVMLSDMPNWWTGGGGKIFRMDSECALQIFFKHNVSTITPFFRDSHFSCSRMPVIVPVQRQLDPFQIARNIDDTPILLENTPFQNNRNRRLLKIDNCD